MTGVNSPGPAVLRSNCWCTSPLSKVAHKRMLLGTDIDAISARLAAMHKEPAQARRVPYTNAVYASYQYSGLPRGGFLDHTGPPFNKPA